MAEAECPGLSEDERLRVKLPVWSGQNALVFLTAKAQNVSDFARPPQLTRHLTIDQRLERPADLASACGLAGFVIDALRRGLGSGLMFIV